MKKRRRFTPEFKAQVVLEVLTGRQSPAEAYRTHALSPNLLTNWKSTFLERAHTLSSPTSATTRTRPASPSWSNCSAGPRVRARSEKKPRRCWMQPRPETGGNQHTQGSLFHKAVVRGPRRASQRPGPSTPAD